jgi:hypothetical protein
MVKKHKKKSVIKQKQTQTQKQIVNIRLDKAVKRTGKRRAAPMSQPNSQPIGFNPVYIQSGSIPPDITQLQNTISGLREEIKNQPIQKQLVMREPMRPIPSANLNDFETGFRDTSPIFAVAEPVRTSTLVKDTLNMYANAEPMFGSPSMSNPMKAAAYPPTDIPSRKGRPVKYTTQQQKDEAIRLQQKQYKERQKMSKEDIRY